MDESKETVADILKELGVGDEQNSTTRSSAEDQTAFDQTAFKESYSEIKERAESAIEPPSNAPLMPTDEVASDNPDKAVENNRQPVVLPSVNCTEISTLKTSIEQIELDVKNISDTSAKTVGEIREMHKLYHNEFANRLQSMQEELEKYREIDKGRAFDGILSEVAKLYTDNEALLEEIEDAKIKKRIRYMFLDIVQILESNGVSKQKSCIGDKRNTKFCQVVERVPTDNPELHDTVFQSRSTGFYVDNRPLIKELVDIYLFAEKNAEISAEN